MALFADGSVTRAVELADDELWAFREKLLDALATPQVPSVALAQACGEFVDAAGKEAPLRRARTRQIMTFVADFYRQVLRVQIGLEPTGDELLLRAVDMLRPAAALSAVAAAACVDRTLAALGHVDRNAHQATTIGCWLDDLAQIVDTGHPLTELEV